MSITTTLVTGIIKGLGGPDLDAFLDDLTSTFGQKLGSILGRIVASSGKELLQEQRVLQEWLRENPTASEKLTAKAFVRASKEAGSPDLIDLLDDYLNVLNGIVGVIMTTNRSLVLRGFLHEAACTSYWEYKSSSINEKPGYFRKDPNLRFIHPPSSQPRVFILNEEPSDSAIEDLNLQVRKSRLGQLETWNHRDAREVSGIREFEVEFRDYRNNTSGIPDGVPGILAMAQSLSTAREAQGLPATKLRETLNSIAHRDGESTT